MSEMETDQVPVSECSRMPISKAIRTHIIIANGYMDLEGTPDTAENYEMKEVLRAARKETLKKKAELVSELRSLPPCTTFNCSCDAIANHFGPLDNEPSNPKANQDSINSTEIVTTPKSDKIKTKSKNKKRKVKKDSSEDFVFPKKTARPVSPLNGLLHQIIIRKTIRGICRVKFLDCDSLPCLESEVIQTISRLLNENII
ncbi:hypothetical protein TNIN_464201 [Trichonephila inaurata madagascariensis]|uniref:Uncharacterized protein n=1 Tax=Trichonephila inaurata madagascariensis TaxID=2747483 RepID=A0A8X6XRG6_9ARAC|nr:hypothetical protein TNIN_464201 [Trichonephila inaurata madagascariensis]